MKRAVPAPARAQEPSVLSGAGKSLTWVFTTFAALLTVLLNARTLGITDWLGGTRLSFADHAAQRVLVSPRADSLFALGDTTLLAATVTDRLGAVLYGARLRWESQDTAIAAVDSSGAVVARGPGQTLVTAWVRERSASSLIRVRPRPARVIIPGDSILRVRLGDTLQLAAVALDARGHRIGGTAPRWTSADTGLVRVDSIGTAIGVRAGTTRLRAAAGEANAELSVRVELAATGLVLLAGGGQRVSVGHRLPEPIVVQAHAGQGQPVPGTVVYFSVPDGEGGVDPDSAVTDRDGRVVVRWSLGQRAGLQRLSARVAHLDSALRIVADADPAPGNTRLELLSGDTTGTAGLAGATPIRVRVTDSSGVALDGVPVRWSAPDGGVVVGQDRTDSLGLATAEWTFGPRAGRQRLLALVGNPRTAVPLGITGVALPGAPAAISLDGGQGQRGIVGTPLGKPVTVTVRDSRGNPVPGVPVAPVPDKGSGAVEPGTTDARGRAALMWTLGTGAGGQAMRVRLAAVDSVLLVRATAEAALPARITIRGLPGKAGATEQRLEASVVDAHGNPVPGVYLSVSAESGRLAATRIRSDQAGRAAIGWTPAKPRAESRLTVRLIGGSLKATHALGIK